MFCIAARNISQNNLICLTFGYLKVVARLNIMFPFIDLLFVDIWNLAKWNTFLITQELGNRITKISSYIKQFFLCVCLLLLSEKNVFIFFSEIIIRATVIQGHSAHNTNAQHCNDLFWKFCLFVCLFVCCSKSNQLSIVITNQLRTNYICSWHGNLHNRLI